jgi:hypothetical protein
MQPYCGARGAVPPKLSIEILKLSVGTLRMGGVMSALQAFFFGMMMAWTPSLVLLAWLLWRDAGSEEQSRGLQQ